MNSSAQPDHDNQEDNTVDRRQFIEAATAGAILAVTPNTPHSIGHLLSPNDMQDNEKEKPADMTREEMEQELTEGNRVEWIAAKDVKTMCCVDGRCKECVAGVAGGEAGLLVAAISASKQEIGDGIMSRIVSQLDIAYLHSDSHAFEHIRHELGLEEMSDAETWAALRVQAQNPEMLMTILEVMTRSESQGCGHMKNMMNDPEAYGTTKEVVVSVVKAIVRKALTQLEETKGRKHATVHCLEGSHQERALLQVQLDGPIDDETLIPLIKPNEGKGEKEFFLYSPQLADREMAKLMRAIEGVTGENIGEHLEAAQQLSGRQTLETALRLAAGKPWHIAKFDLATRKLSVIDNNRVPEQKA